MPNISVPVIVGEMDVSPVQPSAGCSAGLAPSEMAVTCRRSSSSPPHSDRNKDLRIDAYPIIVLSRVETVALGQKLGDKENLPWTNHRSDGVNVRA